MALEKQNDTGAKAPNGPHLGLHTGNATNDVIAIPKGSVMYIITDPTQKDGVLPVVLMSVSPKRIVFGCGCKGKSCNVRYEFRASRTGNHVNARR